MYGRMFVVVGCCLMCGCVCGRVSDVYVFGVFGCYV